MLGARSCRLHCLRALNRHASTSSFATSALVARPPPPSNDAAFERCSSSSSSSFPPPSLGNIAKKAPKESGTIASVFATLSGGSLSDCLPERFGALKKSIVKSQVHAQALQNAWVEVLTSLQQETQEVIQAGADLIPVVQYPGDDVVGDKILAEWLDSKTIEKIKKRGTVIVKGVVSKEEALGYKHHIQDYVAANPHTKGEKTSPLRRRNFALRHHDSKAFPPRIRRYLSSIGPKRSWLLAVSAHLYHSFLLLHSIFFVLFFCPKVTHPC